MLFRMFMQKRMPVAHLFKFETFLSNADTSSERCPSSTSFLNADATTIVRNQSTSPNMPDATDGTEPDDPSQYATPNVQPEENVECVSCERGKRSWERMKEKIICIFPFVLKETVNCSPPIDAKDNNYVTEASDVRPAVRNVKLATESPPISTEYGKKDEIKMLPAVLPVLGYTAAPAPNVYPTAMDSGIQMYPGAPAAPTAFPTTTYQQGVCIHSQPNESNPLILPTI